ncbi:hypothetical protein QCA50_014947 [Cerrena zonata]|uniref:Uncharacterized protein n=1 Tax=Cerrena zonata TaxID=2478898 RepID=A0AAW0FUN7_9APHY
MSAYPFDTSLFLRDGDMLVGQASRQDDGSYLVQYDDPKHIPTKFLYRDFEVVWYIKPRAEISTIVNVDL